MVGATQMRAGYQESILPRLHTRMKRAASGMQRVAHADMTDLSKRPRADRFILDVVDPCSLDPPIDPFSSWIELGAGGAVKARSRGVSAAWGLWTVAAFHVVDNDSVHSDIWERHPAGDEMLFLLSGAVTVHLRDEAGGEVATTPLLAGTCQVVPAGTWHRLTVEDAGDLMVITARANTEHQTESNEAELLGISHR